jgi:hypothetical protein
MGVLAIRCANDRPSAQSSIGHEWKFSFRSLDLEAHAKFQNPMTAPSGRIVKAREKGKIRKFTKSSGHALVASLVAHTLLGPIIVYMQVPRGPGWVCVCVNINPV